MVIPLPDLWHLGRHAAHIGIHQVVAVPATKLIERLGHLAYLFSHQVVPQGAVSQFHLGLDRAVGINGVTAVQKKIRVNFAHLLINFHAAPGLVDAPPLASGVAAPGEAHIAGHFRPG